MASGTDNVGGVESLLLPNVPDLAQDVDGEITNIRAFLQLVAVQHNTAVHNTLQQFTEQRGHLEQLNGTLEHAGTVVQDARRANANAQADLKTMRDVVNGHNEDSLDKLQELIKTADAAAIQAQFRIANAESDSQGVKDDSEKRVGGIEATLKT